MSKKKDDPLTKAQMREALKNPFIQTKIKVRSKWQAPIKYKVLQTFQLNDTDRKLVSKALVLATTPTKAKMVIGRIPPQGSIQEVRAINHIVKISSSYWSYRDISMLKDFDCGILQFKGLAVCLFYKRQCYEFEPVGPDPIPFGALEHEDDIWARLDLFSKSPRELHASVREDFMELTMQNEELKYRLRGEDRAHSEQEQKEYNDLHKKIDEQAKTIASLERRLKAAQAKPSVVSTQRNRRKKHVNK